jgi:uncharacterized protein YabN with tetrapyrrole methylase and pyrophosphatase domain
VAKGEGGNGGAETRSGYRFSKQADELGDLLFSIVNYARFLKIDPDEALERTNRKFMERFRFLETESRKDGKVLGEMSLDEMNAYWERAKAR